MLAVRCPVANTLADYEYHPESPDSAPWAAAMQMLNPLVNPAALMPRWAHVRPSSFRDTVRAGASPLLAGG